MSKNLADIINKVHCADCLDFMRDMPDGCVDLIILDPPYNIGKDVWDKIDNYIEWLMGNMQAYRRVLKDNGSLYLFHSEIPIIAELIVAINQKTDFIYRQFITWNKRFKGSPYYGYLNGYVEVDGLRNYQQLAEYILFYTLQDGTGLSKTMGHAVYLIRDYIRSEIVRAKGRIHLKEVNTVLGTATNGGGVASACLSLDKTMPAMITGKHYEILRRWLNADGREYEYLRKEYEDLRYTFNNQKTHHSVWNYDIEVGNKDIHCTPKPQALIENIIQHSSRKEQIIFDPFLGSGTTAVAAKQLGRNFIGVEINPEYCRIAEERLKQEVLPFTRPQSEPEKNPDLFEVEK